MKSAYRLLVFALGLGSLALTACSQDVKIPVVPAEAAMAPKGPMRIVLRPEQEKQIGLAVSRALVRPFPVNVQATGQVKAAADLVAHISTPAAGRVTAVMVRLGQPIANGQAIATLKSDEVGQIQADLLQSVLQADADIRSAKVQLAFSKAAYEREQKLFNDRISSRADLEAARTQYDKDLNSYEALQTRQRATITIAQERLSLYGVSPGIAAQVVRTRRVDPYITISAPRSGILLARAVNTGELADPSKELFSTADLSRVWLVANIYEKDIERVHAGQTVKLTLDSLPGRVYPGRISYIANALDPETRTLSIRADVPNPGGALKPDMFARMQVLIGNTGVLSVPRSALQRSGDFTYAYVPVGNHRYEERRVEVGTDDGQFIAIKSGLKPGEVVVTHGTLALQGEALKLSGGIQ